MRHIVYIVIIIPILILISILLFYACSCWATYLGRDPRALEKLCVRVAVGTVGEKHQHQHKAVRGTTGDTQTQPGHCMVSRHKVDECKLTQPGRWSVVVIARTMKLVSANTGWSLVSDGHCTDPEVGKCKHSLVIGHCTDHEVGKCKHSLVIGQWSVHRPWSWWVQTQLSHWSVVIAQTMELVSANTA